MLQKTVSILFIVVTLLLYTNKEEICTCLYNYEVAYKDYNSVFSAKILSVSNANTSNYNKKAKLELIKIYKGEPKTIIMTEIGGCSTPRLIQNREWIFFTSEENGVQVLSSCNPSIKLYPRKFIKKKPERLKVWKIKLEENLKLLDSLSQN